MKAVHTQQSPHLTDMQNLSPNETNVYKAGQNMKRQKPEMHSEPCQTSKIECFAKIVNYFRKTLNLKYLTVF